MQISRPMKVVVDCGNGVAGNVAPRLYAALGCEVVELFCDVNGHFPNHHPDPTLADAILDRLVHNAYKLALTGESMRKKQSKLT